MVFLDRDGYPVEKIKGHLVRNILRRVIHTRRIRKGYWDGFGVVRKRKAAGGD